MLKVRRNVKKSGGTKRRRVIMFRLGRIDDVEGAKEFDRVFWRRVGAQGRFEAMWDMLRMYSFMKGGDGTVPRLRRAATSLQRR
jgi:hypothetical protein